MLSSICFHQRYGQRYGDNILTAMAKHSHFDIFRQITTKKADKSIYETISRPKYRLIKINIELISIEIQDGHYVIQKCYFDSNIISESFIRPIEKRQTMSETCSALFQVKTLNIINTLAATFQVVLLFVTSDAGT